ncbi:MAG: SH3 domain-containing protein [Beijerinckiaceae bacterium]|nr:SH3 domain-containing protein [Beijerinckiaceae bacterium]
MRMTRFPRGPALAGLLLVCSGFPAFAQAIPAGASRCSFDAFTVDGQGRTNVRAAPSTRSAILGTVPSASRRIASPDEGAGVSVVASVNGFFLVREIDLADIETASPDRKLGKVYRGSGWIHGSQLTFHIQSGDGLRATPDRAAPVSIRFRQSGPDGIGDPDAVVLQMHSCSGRNVQATLTTTKGKELGRGWLVRDAQDGQAPPIVTCPLQLTTCN